MEGLKLCPFCEREQLQEPEKNTWDVWAIYCHYCNARSPGTFKTKEEAVIAWNTRPIEASLRDQLSRKEAECGLLKERCNILAEMRTNAEICIADHQVEQYSRHSVPLEARLSENNTRLREIQEENRQRLEEVRNAGS